MIAHSLEYPKSLNRIVVLLFITCLFFSRELRYSRNFGIKVVCLFYNIHVGLALVAGCSFRRRMPFKTCAAAYRNGCLYWGGISFTTA